MILYVNGDSHAAAAECVNPCAFAEDDEFFYGLGRKPHPDNLRASFGVELANQLYAILDCDAESASSNDRIIRTTREYLNRADPELIVIQWSTWEREEWLIDGTYYQVNASGVDNVPEDYQDQYREFVINVNWAEKTQQAHELIWNFHREIQDIPHVFFNGNNHFESILARQDWNNSYINPYDATSTFDHILRTNGFATVRPDSWHFGPKAHCFWGNFLLQYCIEHKLVKL